MKQLKITRLKEWANRRFNYTIVVDGQEQFEIASGQEKVLTIDKATTLQAKLMWCGSKKIEIKADEQQLKEIRIKANKGANILFPVMAFFVLIASSVVNLVYADSGLKMFITSVMVGGIIYALALVTIWRNTFLDIELVRE
ncbi:MAG: hypothetical protein IM574_09975 [Cytophagales bacterium]|jgi:hypothetical protein|nr:hypothetical protein [Cytophagales bacterium]MCA6386723.1 hypothetical protein [Cytophagales bacterium]MCA6392478.1 hypothetical protein [Cytophagales bacterium]MCA6394218.1 hypothetical protein [Cytophagales bacterium]MCA6398950.1 hypothetical protein [Cytophagales bacterium]